MLKDKKKIIIVVVILILFIAYLIYENIKESSSEIDFNTLLDGAENEEEQNKRQLW